MLSYCRPRMARPSASSLLLHNQCGLLMEPYPAGGTWEVRGAVGSFRSLSPTGSSSSNIPGENIFPFVACLCSLCKELHALREQKVKRPGGRGGRVGKSRGRLFLRFYISDRFGESCIPVSLPYAWSELFLTCTLECRTVNTISIKSHGKQTFWCGWYLFASCRQVDLIRTAFTTFAKRFETGWHAQQLPEPEWHSIPRLHLISTGDGLINDN